MKVLKLNKESVNKAAQIIKNGGAVVFPPASGKIMEVIG